MADLSVAPASPKEAPDAGWFAGVMVAVVHTALVAASGWLMASQVFPAMQGVVSGEMSITVYRALSMVTDVLVALISGALAAAILRRHAGWWLALVLMINLGWALFGSFRMVMLGDVTWMDMAPGMVFWVPGMCLLPLTYWLWRHVFGLGRVA